jgi:hypothetical protein
MPIIPEILPLSGPSIPTLSQEKLGSKKKWPGWKENLFDT